MAVRVPPERLTRWIENFTARHGPTDLTVDADGRLAGRAADGSAFTAAPPFGRAHAGHVDAFSAACVPPADWGVLLVRKGGFAIARLHGPEVVGSKTGQRHVQGRTKAGGQSQQRFARRRDNQAREAFEAAADHAARLLAGVPVLVVGGERRAIDAVLADPRLPSDAVVGDFLTVPDPRRAVLDAAILDAGSVLVDVVNA